MRENELLSWSRERGCGVAWGPAAVVEEARREIAGRRAEGELDDRFYQAELASLATQPGPAEGTVVVVAKPRPATRLVFHLEGGTVDAILPPTYLRYRATFEDVRQDLAAHALPGARVEHLAGSIKAVASRLGLVRYGRNNVSYLPGAGSYIQLCGYRTDARLDPASTDDRGPRLLDQCQGCTRCLRACPTRAIGPDRLLLHAERCLTFMNERDDPWPDWVSTRAHRCLLGCLFCQRACPVNPELPVEEPALEFTEEETRALLDSAQEAASPGATGLRAKLAWLGRSDPEPLLGRNLRALIRARRPG